MRGARDYFPETVIKIPFNFLSHKTLKGFFATRMLIG
jgi:hypothetical protein